MCKEEKEEEEGHVIIPQQPASPAARRVCRRCKAVSDGARREIGWYLRGCNAGVGILVRGAWCSVGSAVVPVQQVRGFVRIAAITMLVRPERALRRG